ncbi:hypothetical protein Tco_1043044 [Tanacetum coccineum]|uniref:Uncharacterized protein n=1 Tax=Tanacetum coccineum TaxID=301880 RepID=A0ABQ5GLW6_9ASTR
MKPRSVVIDPDGWFLSHLLAAPVRDTGEVMALGGKQASTRQGYGLSKGLARHISFNSSSILTSATVTNPIPKASSLTWEEGRHPLAQFASKHDLILSYFWDVK